MHYTLVALSAAIATLPFLVTDVLALNDVSDTAQSFSQQLHIMDKTLVAWVTLANLTQRGGSALTIEDTQARFDGIVFGELSPGKWMAGSDFYKRTQRDQSGYPEESAAPNSLIQIAIVYHCSQVTIYREGNEYARYDIQKPRDFGKDSLVVFGIRHIEANDGACFSGSIADARIYDVALTQDQIKELRPGKPSDPKPLAWWDFKEGLQDRMGIYTHDRLSGGARIEGGRLTLQGDDACFIARSYETPQPYLSPIHFRPAFGALADTIPYFIHGEYHVFYLHAVAGTPWEHIASKDLIHWRELPTALKPDKKDPNGPDGGNMFTGSVIEYDGTYHIFYTGHNPRNPNGMEMICHATSPDGVTWTKHLSDVFCADGIHYLPKSDFRDPYVFRNTQVKSFWMLLCTREAGDGKPVVGVAHSKDLTNWDQVKPLSLDPPLAAGTPECPDLFKTGDTWYLLYSPCEGTTDIRYAKELNGPWRQSSTVSIDTSILYAAKRMFDGKRNILVGWIRDLGGNRDNGAEMWGGTMCLPRVAYEGPNGTLFFKPAPEVVDVFTKTVHSAKLTVRPGDTITMEAPDNYMLDCRVRLEPHAEFAIAFREQKHGKRAYLLTISPGRSEAGLTGEDHSSARKCIVNTSKPIKIQAFLQGTILECFINDEYAFSRRVYNLAHGSLGLSVTGGAAKVEELQIRLPGINHTDR